MAEPKNVGERLARAELQIERIEEDIDAEAKDIAAVIAKLDKIDQELSRYRGIVGGILFVATALVTFFKMFSQDIVHFFQK